MPEVDPMPLENPMENGNQDQDVDDELMNMASEELMQSIEKKDKRGMLEAIKAIVLSLG